MPSVDSRRKTSSLAIFSFAIFIWAVFSTPLVGLQIVLWNDSYYTFLQAKMLLSIFSLFVFFLLFDSKIEKSLFFSISFFLLLVALSIISVVSNFQGHDFIYYSSIVAYYYLTFTCLLLSYFVLCCKSCLYISDGFFNKIYRLIVLFIFLSFLLSIYRSYTGGCVFDLVECNSLKYYGFRISSINGLERAFAVQQRPIDLGIMFSFLCLFFCGLYYFNKKLSVGLLSFMCFVIVFLTFSRTAYLMLATSIFVFFMYFSRFNLNIKAFLLVCFFVLSCIFILFVFFGGGGGVMDPHNLVLRFGHWSDALYLLSEDTASLFFGLGRVQNGSFGEAHALVMDNTYIAVLMISGVLGLVFYLIFWIFFVLSSSVFYSRYLHDGSVFFTVEISMFVGFLTAGLTENLLNRLYLVVVFLILWRLFFFFYMKKESET